MIKKILIITYLFISNILIYSQIEIPINSDNKAQLSNWLVAKVSNIDEEQINKVLENTKEFLRTIPYNDLKELNLSNFNDVAIPFYQVFDSINFKNSLIAITMIESEKDQYCQLQYAGYDIISKTYLNGSLIASSSYTDNEIHEVKLKKGKNKLIVIGKPNGAYNATISMKIYNEKRGQLIVNIKDKNGKKVDFANSMLYNKNSKRYKNISSGTKFKLPADNYKIIVGDGRYSSWSNDIEVNEYDTKVINLTLNKEYKISGTIYTIDEKTPNPGISIELIDLSNNRIQEITHSNENGMFDFFPPKGKWNIRVFTEKGYLYHQTNGINTIIEVNDKQQKFNANLSIPVQVKGTWNQISMFDGMLSNGAHVSIVSREDLLYLGTYNGLSIYDGLKVISYNYDQGLPNGPIVELFEDSKGFIWIGYIEKGLVKWKDGKVISHYTKKEGLPSNFVNALDEDEKGNIIIGTNSGLSIFNGEEFKNYDFSSGIGNGFITDVKAVGKSIWIGCGTSSGVGNWMTIGGGLSIFNGNKFKSFDLSKFTDFDHRASWVNSIEKDKNGNVWIGTLGGLLKYDGSQFTLISERDGLQDNSITELYCDDEGLWAGTDNGLVNIKNGIIKTIVPIEKNGLSFENIQSISKSSDGVYFVGTANGVSLYDPNSFRKMTSLEGMPIPPNWTSGILDLKFDKDGFLWAASGVNGLLKIKNERIERVFNTKNSDLESNYVNQLEFSDDGAMWLSSGGSVYRYNNGEIKIMDSELEIPAYTSVQDIAFDNEGTIWLATNRGLGRFKNGDFKLFNEADGLVRADGNCDVNIGKNEEIIYSTYGYGFSIFNGNEFINFDESNGLGDNRIWDLAVDSKNNYWLALDGKGVEMFDGKEFHSYQIKDGITAGETFTAHVDDFDNVWIGTFGGGVCYFDGDIWNSVDTRDGLLDDLVGSICSIDGNKYWFGSENGITAYIPKQQTPSVFLEKIETASESFNSIDELLDKKGKILQETRVTFTLKSNSFNTKKEKQKYIVNIIRKGKKESQLIKSNKFEFFPEKIGKYIIEFQSIDRDMNYSKLKQIEINVVGPWYKNLATAIPFWGFLLLLISLSGYSSNKYLSQRKYTAKLKEEAQIKDREARERLEEKNKEIVDSINYAKRIQDAMMTSEGYRKSVIPKSFTFFKPKDVVSGDFYWVFKDKEENIFFTVADCTGHGVPGAFMSMIGTSLLNEIIVEKGIKDTNKILDEMRSLIIKSLNQDEDDDQKDGMDISICKLNLKKNSLEFSGAHNPLLVVSEGEIKTYKGDSQAVGLETVNIKPFTKHIVKLQKNDMIYIYSDGYQDQFGGENGKKYMAANFKKLLLKLSKEDEKKQNKLLEIELANWMKNQEQIDDICIMGVRV
jgi:ligand-binding sensor domain-containing protein/serine phosphatase RsbU (regulator of sigma subunit)